MDLINAGIVGLLLFSSAQAQTADPAFAAVSIKQATLRRYGGVEFKPGGRLTANDVSIYQLVNAAYGLTGTERVRTGANCPNWIDSEHFDVEAVAQEGVIPDNLGTAQLRERMQPLLRQLLADRFQMVIRREPKEMPVYMLTMAKSGVKLTKASISDAECGASIDCHHFSGNRMRGLRGAAVSMTDLAFALEAGSNRPMVDATGIVGLFSMEVRPFATLKPQLDDYLESIPEAQRPPAEPVKPSLFSVLEKDFGLLLRPSKARVETLLIETVKMPSAN